MPELFYYLLSKKLSGDASQQEIVALHSMLLDNAVLQEEAHNIEAFWKRESHQHKVNTAELAQLYAEAMADYNDYKTASSTSIPIHKPLFRKAILRWTVAATIAILIALTISLNWGSAPKNDTKHEQIVWQNNNSKPQKQILPDGSAVWLNAATTLTYNSNFGISNRQVTLSGEAYFDVKKNVQLPFYITTKEYTVKVTGTAFNVRAYDDEEQSETALIRGEVVIMLNQDTTKTFTLKPTQKFSIGQVEQIQASSNIKPQLAGVVAAETSAANNRIQMAGIKYSFTDSAVIETSWMQSKLSFQEDNFRQVADKMEKWYQVQISFENLFLQQEVLTGAFIDETLNDALQALATTTKFNFIIDNQHVFIFSKP